MVKLGSAPAKMKSAPVPSRSGSTQNMASNIKVVVRVRPPNDRELEQNHRLVVDVVDEQMLVFDPKEEMRPFFYQGVQQPSKNFLKRANKELKFVFDRVCDQRASNKDVFELTTKEMLASLMEGYNCSVFAYGATGAGKTFTMIGTHASPGITYLTMEHLFYTIAELEIDREFDIGVSYIEVYNENVYDLLKPSSTPLQLRQDPKFGVMVAGLTLNSIRTAGELLTMLENGNKNRTQHPTDANAESSRSHAVFQVYVKMRYKTSSQRRLVKLSMIDLAGSERASATGCSGDRFKEGANINRSLLALGNCINKLADGSSYIPYRDSKLTRLLQDSLGGHCRTVMIANVSPSGASYEDSYNTLKYAARANKIQLSIKKSAMDGDARVSQYVRVIDELKLRLRSLEAELSLSSVKSGREPDAAKDRVKQVWRDRISQHVESHSVLESSLLGAMCRQKVLALRQRLRARAFSHVADLAHRSSSEDMQQLCEEDIPRQERAAENFTKQSVHLDAQIRSLWLKWKESLNKMNALCEKALSDCPDLVDFVEKVRLQSENRLLKSSDELRYKLLSIEHEEINAFTEYMSDMPSMIKKLYLTLKGYDKAPPALTHEYLELMKRIKSAKGISWSDDVTHTDPHFKFISTLTLDEPASCLQFTSDKHDAVSGTASVDIVTDSDDLTDIENREPAKQLARKRKGTPIKLANNETIIINDSFENLDATKTMSSCKKVKHENYDQDVENYGLFNAKDLNSTFVLAGKMEALKKAIKFEKCDKDVPVKRGITDRTNTMPRNFNFSDKSPAARVVKPAAVGRVAPLRRPPPAPRGPGFGSSLARDGTPLYTTNQVRARERFQNHPYSRPPLAARK